MRIVVVEDEVDLNRLLVRRLTRLGHEVLGAADGLEGLDLIRTSTPDVAIVDWMMPRMSGLEMIQRLRELDPNTTTRFLMLTARSQGSDKERALAAGADDYLVKPFAAADLVSKVAGLEAAVAEARAAGQSRVGKHADG
ncbi:response regulator [Leucobacter sp. cx-42]|uniref:response regulator transcription factor n=1 Tax=unclassified Leucobacter TaxID=2621730 RepID=UPI00165D59FA|nr:MULTISPECIES: response regulator [unclassified Leucobacter]MBC9954457.1 response regulator [Leucobacter sp. cx-42]